MKFKIAVIIIGAIVLLSGCTTQNKNSESTSDTDSLKWYSYTDGMNEVNKTGKPAMLFFCTFNNNSESYSQSFCKLVEDELFSNDTVKSMLKKFILIKVEVYDQSQEWILSKYKFVYTPFPLVIFLNSKGKELSRLVAYGIYDPSDKNTSIERFIEVLNLTLKGKVKGEDFRFVTLSGKEKHLSEYRNKVVVLDLMSVNCPACRKEMEYLSQVKDHYMNDDTVVIISIDVAKDAADYIKTAYADYIGKWTFGMDKYGEASKYLLENAIPTIVVIDELGRIFYLRAGALPAQNLIELIENVKGN